MKVSCIIVLSLLLVSAIAKKRGENYEPCGDSYGDNQKFQNCDNSLTFDLQGTRAIIIITSHNVQGDLDCEDCPEAGLASCELTTAYYQFRDAGIDVTIASVQGGEVPVEEEWRCSTLADKRFYDDSVAVAGVKNSVNIQQLENLDSYDFVYVPGGFGSSWDLGTDEQLGKLMTQAYAANKVIGVVCHGTLALVRATKPDGTPLVQGLTVTGVSNQQVKDFGMFEKTPHHPEIEVEKLGANYIKTAGTQPDGFQAYVHADGNIVSGQNQNTGCATAQRMMQVYSKNRSSSSQGTNKSDL